VTAAFIVPMVLCPVLLFRKTKSAAEQVSLKKYVKYFGH